MPLVAGLLVAAVVLLARWVSTDLALVAGPAAATTVIALGITRTSRRLTLHVDRREARQRQRADEAMGRLEQRMKRGHRRLFAQLEALDAVRDTMSGAVALPATGGWAASPDILREIVGTVVRDRPQVVLETGSGASTIAIATCLRRNGGGHLWSLEHLPEFAASARRVLASLDLADYVTVLDAPLVDTVIPGGTWPWYDIAGLLPDGPIDLLLVDGPPASTAGMARYPALPVLRSRLAEHAVVILDDASRPDERQCVTQWQAEMPGLQARYLPFEKGAYVLEMGG